MTIQFVGSTTDASVGSLSPRTISITGLTGGLASSPAADDLVVITYAIASQSDVGIYVRNLSSVDYTNVTTRIYEAGDLYDTVLLVAYRFMPSAPETQAIISPSDAVTNARAVAVHVFRGVDQTTPIDVTATTASGINSFLANPPSITPTTAGAWILACGGGAGQTVSGSGYTATGLTAFTTIGSADSYDALVGAGYYDAWTSGAYDPSAFTGGGTDSTDNSWAALTLALRPANPPATGNSKFFALF